jgi:orotidine-5'-phosphate decarboxylase
LSSLIVALDFDNQSAALKLVDLLDPANCAVKIGSEMFTLFGAGFVKNLIQKNFKVFLDLKFHDIPTTVAKACVACADLGVWMLNVHALGGIDMMQSVRAALEPYGNHRPLLIAVTVLTSLVDADLVSMGIEHKVTDYVGYLAKTAHKAGLDGVVCSAHDVRTIKSLCGENFVTVTPGIRLENSPLNDQARVMTPAEVKRVGSDYFVVGRPITQAQNPSQVIEQLLISQK